MFAKITAFFLSVASLFLSLFNFMGITNDYKFSFDVSDTGETLPNIVSNVNVWDMGTQFINAKNTETNDIYDFVEYVQLMECTGGSYSRDLFKNPEDRTVMDDYDFLRLVKNCRGILNLGAKPMIKVGNVPMKYTAKSKDGYFGVNVFAPDDYEVYYNYLSALFKTLVDEFGRDEVLTWHFGVMTEYENSDWFDCGSPKESFEAYCKIYDYAVDAMQKQIGENVYVGAHSMTVTEGLWDEREFIKHCAVGTNSKTGKTGTRICYLSFSYYEAAVGKGSNGMTIAECVEHLLSAAEKYGLKGLDCGIDEGRVLCGSNGRTDSQLNSRTVGYRWQAATDARLYKQCFDNGMSYFSSWYYKSSGLNSGNPTLSFHVANLISKWKGAERMNMSGTKSLGKKEVDMMGAVGEDTVYLMAYNYRNDLKYSAKADLSVDIKVQGRKDGKVKVTAYPVNDDCNYYDDWLKDREKYGIGDDACDWSPDCPCIGANLTDRTARQIYFNELEAKYAQCSTLVPKELEAEIKDGVLHLDYTLGGNEVVFFEIQK